MKFEELSLHLDNLRSRLRDGKASIGGWLQIPSAVSARIVAENNYDWVVVDLEHGSIGHDDLVLMCQAIFCAGKIPMARVSSPEPLCIKLALEAGVAGLIIPNIKSAVELSYLIESCLYPPLGTRGVGFSAANRFGRDLPVILRGNFHPFVVAMVENRDAIEDLDAILKVPCLDAIFVGPYDLSASLGVTGDFGNGVFADALAAISKMASELSIPSGIHVVEADPKEVKSRIAEGFQFIAYALDSVLLKIDLEEVLK